MPATRRNIGVYQPRSRKAAFADALADARRTVARALRVAMVRAAGALVFLGASAGLVALATFSPNDPSLSNATGREPSNWLGGFGATAAALLLQTFGIAALAFLTPPAIWGARAMTGRAITRPVWRAAAWPLATVFVAGGLGILPRLEALPAGTGGLLGLAIAGLSRHAGQSYHQSWLGIAVPALLLVLGLPLAFFATGLRFRPIWRAIVNIPAFFVWLAGQLPRRAHVELADDEAFETVEEDEAQADDEEDEDPSSLSIRPEPVGGLTRADERRREIRVKRDERKVAKSAKTARQ